MIFQNETQLLESLFFSILFVSLKLITNPNFSQNSIIFRLGGPSIEIRRFWGRHACGSKRDGHLPVVTSTRPTRKLVSRCGILRTIHQKVQLSRLRQYSVGKVNNTYYFIGFFI